MKSQGLNVVGSIFSVLFLCVQVCFGLSISSYTSDADGITCTCNTGVMKVKICGADIVRVAYSPTSTIPARPLQVVTNTWAVVPSFTKAESGDTILLQTGRIKVKVSKTTANVSFTDLNNTVICSEYGKSITPATVEGVSTNTVAATWNSPADEGLFGLGQHQFGIVNFKGQTQVLDEDYGTLATAVSVLVSTYGYGIFWDNYSKTTFSGNLSNNTRWSFSSECGDVLDYYFFYGPEIDQVVSGYRTATGKVPLFPKWAFGLIQSKDRYNSQSDIYSVRDGYRNNSIPLDCIVQDWHYWDGAGQQGCYCFNSSYGNYNTTITQLHSAHLHTMVSIWSQLEQGSPPFNTFNSSGWLWPTDNSCTTHFIDAYSSPAREAFWNLIRDNMFDTTKIGFDSWWLDNDEPFAYPCGFNRHSLTTAMGKGCLYYNSYTFPMTRMGYANWRRDIPGKRFVILHRANFAGQQAHSAMQWSNDIQCNFAVLNNQLPAGLNSTLTGIPYWTTDIGGYWGSNGIDWSTPTNRELMTRWLQYGAFCPVFRIHGNGPSKELYQTCWDATTKANLLLTDKLHYRLMPYIYSLAWMTTNNDYTPMRHLIFDFRTDPNVKSIGNQFMYGPAFLVSPVTTQGATSRSAYIPAGKWYDFWTGATVTAGNGTIQAPLSQIPLHVRAGSIVPMGPEIQYATQRADTIELRIYPGANGSFTMYEDEGDNYNYETGKYATIPISYADPHCVHIGARNGSFNGMQANKVFNIVYVGSNHGVGEAKTATPDTVINYSGVDCGCATGAGIITPSGLPGLPMHWTMRTYDAKVIMDRRYGESVKELSVYDLKGRLVYRAVTKSNEIDFGKKAAASKAVYIVKINVLPKL